MAKKKYMIDADVVIESYNKNNPDKEKLTAPKLATMIGKNHQIFSAWKNEYTPKIIESLMMMAEIGGVKLDDFITVKKKKK